MGKGQPPHVIQAENELANATALGLGDRAKAARKALAAAGAERAREVREATTDEQQARSTPPKGRTATQRETAADAEAKAIAPQGRRGRPRDTRRGSQAGARD